VDVNAESSPLQPANRDGGIDQDWAGDDQDWWDWYVTLAENDDAPIALVAGPGLPDVDPADAVVIISPRLDRTRDGGQVCPRVSEVPGHKACQGTLRAHLPLAAEPLGFPQGGLDVGHADVEDDAAQIAAATTGHRQPTLPGIPVQSGVATRSTKPQFNDCP